MNHVQGHSRLGESSFEDFHLPGCSRWRRAVLVEPRRNGRAEVCGEAIELLPDSPGWCVPDGWHSHIRMPSVSSWKYPTNQSLLWSRTNRPRGYELRGSAVGGWFILGFLLIVLVGMMLFGNQAS